MKIHYVAINDVDEASLGPSRTVSSHTTWMGGAHGRRVEAHHGQPRPWAPLVEVCKGSNLEM